VANEVVMIREHRPRLQMPSEIMGDFQQTTMKDLQPVFAAEMVQF
jgi:hypothetical protein